MDIYRYNNNIYLKEDCKNVIYFLKIKCLCQECEYSRISIKVAFWYISKTKIILAEIKKGSVQEQLPI